MNLRDLFSQRDEQKASATAVLNEFAASDAEEMTAEQKTKLNGHKTEISRLDKKIDAAIQANELERTAGRELFDNTPLAPGAQVRENFENDPKGGFDSHVDFLQAVMAVETDKIIDPRLNKWKAPISTKPRADQQSTTQSAYGGFLVPAAVVPGLLTVKPEDDPLESMTRTVEMDADRVELNARVDKNHSTSVSGGLVVTRRPEVADGTSSRMEFEQIVLDANELYGIAFASERLLRRSPSSFASLLRSGFGEEFASHKFYERIHGTGVGEPLGILSGMADGTVTVAKTSGQTADTISQANLNSMVARCWKFSKAIWLINHSTIPQLLSLTVSAGDSLVDYFKFTDSGMMMLLGRPLYVTEYCNALGDKGDIILGVWSEYLDGEVGGVNEATSIHVRFLSNQTAFKFWKLNDGKPWWTSALTQHSGSGTLSPFVTLAERA